jgi:multiple sugar transport system ATP-binding protein
LVFVGLNDTKVTCRVHPGEAKSPGEAMNLVVDAARAILFDPQTDQQLQ